MAHRNAFNSFIRENWRDVYRPITRYPEIYKEHRDAGYGLLTEDAPGYWDLATKPLGALMYSGIPALYEALRDEPIRNTLRDDLGFSQKAADYTTQGIGLGLDIGLPYSVIKHGLTPFISEAVKTSGKTPTSFSPARRRFLQGTAAAAAVGTGSKAAVKYVGQAKRWFVSPFHKAKLAIFDSVKGAKTLADLETVFLGTGSIRNKSALGKVVDYIMNAKHGDAKFPPRRREDIGLKGEQTGPGSIYGEDDPYHAADRMADYPEAEVDQLEIDSSGFRESAQGPGPRWNEDMVPQSEFGRARARKRVFNQRWGDMGEDWKTRHVTPTREVVEELYKKEREQIKKNEAENLRNQGSWAEYMEDDFVSDDMADLRYYSEYLDENLTAQYKTLENAEKFLKEEPELFIQALDSQIDSLLDDVIRLEGDVEKYAGRAVRPAYRPGKDESHRFAEENMDNLEPLFDDLQTHQGTPVVPHGQNPYHTFSTLDQNYGGGPGGALAHANQELEYLMELRHSILSQEGAELGKFKITGGKLSTKTSELPKKKKKDGNLLQRILDPLGYKNIKW